MFCFLIVSKSISVLCLFLCSIDYLHSLHYEINFFVSFSLNEKTCNNFSVICFRNDHFSLQSIFVTSNFRVDQLSTTNFRSTIFLSTNFHRSTISKVISGAMCGSIYVSPFPFLYSIFN